MTKRKANPGKKLGLNQYAKKAPVAKRAKNFNPLAICDTCCKSMPETEFEVYDAINDKFYCNQTCHGVESYFEN